MQPIITIFCAFTRQWAVDTWLANLEAVNHDPALTNLCFIVDGNQHLIANTLKKYSDKKGYRSFHVKINEDWQPNEVRLAIRRNRIAEVHNQSKDLITRCDGDIIIGLEDDTVFDRLVSFEPLYAKLDAGIGFVEGVQMGRWGANIIGAWLSNGTPNFNRIETMLPKSGYEHITAGGFYGYATYRHLYLNHDYYSSSSQPWGPDVNYGLFVQSQGYDCLINWDIVFGHNDYNQTLYPDDPKIRLVQVVYNKDKLTGKWERTDHEQTSY